MDKEKEIQFILEFAEGTDLCESNAMNQLRSLWTSFCIHCDLDPDTSEYDHWIREIWNVIEENPSTPFSSLGFERFYTAMCKYLV